MRCVGAVARHCSFCRGVARKGVFFVKVNRIWCVSERAPLQCLTGWGDLPSGGARCSEACGRVRPASAGACPL